MKIFIILFVLFQQALTQELSRKSFYGISENGHSLDIEQDELNGFVWAGVLWSSILGIAIFKFLNCEESKILNEAQNVLQEEQKKIDLTHFQREAEERNILSPPDSEDDIETEINDRCL